MKNLLLLTILIFAVALAGAQETEKKSKKERKAEKKAQDIAKTSKLIKSKAFVFKANSANPMKGGSRTLTSDYDVKIQSDSIFSYLPFFGRAYSANFGGGSPMIFDSPITEYKIEDAKKGGKLIKMVTNNKNDRLEYTFHISDTGTTNLIVISNNRQSISYYGYLTEIVDKSKKKE